MPILSSLSEENSCPSKINIKKKSPLAGKLRSKGAEDGAAGAGFSCEDAKMDSEQVVSPRTSNGKFCVKGSSILTDEDIDLSALKSGNVIPAQGRCIGNRMHIIVDLCIYKVTP